MGTKTNTRHPIPQLRRGTEAKSNDPYGSRKGSKDPAKCGICQSVYHRKRWYTKEDRLDLDVSEKTMTITVCPTCRKTRENYPQGVVTLRGEFLAENKDEILHLIRNEEERTKRINPVARIISVKDTDDGIEIQTTSERFAERLGKEVKKAFKGELHFHWSKGDKLVRVEWVR
ncbi:MAG TPA: BCAM0308 family protein [Nitrospiria bacterium]|nr:BCAM0308 family protein [Nitrospiria bacterium]